MRSNLDAERCELSEGSGVCVSGRARARLSKRRVKEWKGKRETTVVRNIKKNYVGAAGAVPRGPGLESVPAKPGETHRESSDRRTVGEYREYIERRTRKKKKKKRVRVSLNNFDHTSRQSDTASV